MCRHCSEVWGQVQPSLNMNEKGEAGNCHRIFISFPWLVPPVTFTLGISVAFWQASFDGTPLMMKEARPCFMFWHGDWPWLEYFSLIACSASFCPTARGQWGLSLWRKSGSTDQSYSHALRCVSLLYDARPGGSFAAMSLARQRISSIWRDVPPPKSCGLAWMSIGIKYEISIKSVAYTESPWGPWMSCFHLLPPFTGFWFCYN